MPIGFKVAMTYALLPCASLIVDEAGRMPNYMGFFDSKALSLAWALLKSKKIVPSHLPFEGIV